MDETVAGKALLAAAGLEPSEAEIEALAAGYARNRKAIGSLFAITEARYESPALGFDPDPQIADW